MRVYVQITYGKAMGLAIRLFGNTFGGGSRKNSIHYFANQAQKDDCDKNPFHLAYKAFVAAGCRKVDTTEVVLIFEIA